MSRTIQLALCLFTMLIPAVVRSQTALPTGKEISGAAAFPENLRARPGFPAPGTGAKTNAMQARLIAQANRLPIYNTDSLWNPDSFSMLYSRVPRSVKADTQLVFRRASAGATLAIYRRFINQYNSADFRTGSIMQDMTDTGWKNVMRLRHFPDANGQDTLQLQDTFSHAARSFAPYFESRVTYYIGAPRQLHWSLSSYWNIDSGRYIPGMFVQHAYDPAGNRTGSLQIHWFNGRVTSTGRDTMIYSPASKLLEQYSQSLVSGRWITIDSLSIAYNAVDSPTLRSKFSTTTLSRPLDERNLTWYSYDAAGRLHSILDSAFIISGGIFVREERHSYTYDPAGRRESYRHDLVTPTTTTIDSVWTRYNSRGDEAEVLSFTNRLQIWHPYFATRHTFDLRGNPDSTIEQTVRSYGDPLMNSAMHAFRYDSLNQLTLWQYYRSDNNLWSFRGGFENRYYYEHFDNAPLSTNPGQRPEQPEVRLYPVPANESVSLEVRLALPGNFRAAISDLTGRIIKSWEDRAENSARRSIHVGNLAPGLYYMTVRTGTGIVSNVFEVRH